MSSGDQVIAPIKQNIIKWAVFGEGNINVEQIDRYQTYLSEFERILSTILPKEIGFIRLAVRNTKDIVFETEAGEFMLDAVSGGISSIITLML